MTKILKSYIEAELWLCMSLTEIYQQLLILASQISIFA